MIGIFIGLSVILFSSCSKIDKGFTINKKEAVDSVDKKGQELQEKNLDSQNKTIKDYYPFKENIKYSYEGKGIEYASYITFVDYIKEDRIQLRTNNGGTEVVKIIEYKDGELKLVFAREEAYYREDLTSKPANRDEILLKEPLIKGTAWTLKDGRKRYISNVDEEVSTPLGNFSAIEVITEGEDSKTYDYYAPNIGLIKTVYTGEDFEVTSTLSKLEEKTPLVQNIKIYYPNINDEKLYFINNEVNFNTNDITKMKLEKLFKISPKDELGALLGPNVKIKSLYLNQDNIVYVDFSKELVEEMNAGSGYELMLLQSITNTLGNYYGVDKVYITVENEPYSSGHILMKKGEVFKVNYGDAVEIRQQK